MVVLLMTKEEIDKELKPIVAKYIKPNKIKGKLKCIMYKELARSKKEDTIKSMNVEYMRQVKELENAEK